MPTKQRGYGYPSVFFIAALLLPFIFAAFFAFPEADDFSPALKASHMFDFIGGIDNMFSAWWKWSGRYAFHFSWVFFGDIAEYRGTYTGFILFSFFIAWLSVWGIARELNKPGSAGHSVFTATLWLFALLCTYGSVSQWYLLVEILTLIAGYSMILLYLWSLCRLWNRIVVTRGSKWFCIISCVAASGFYEYSGLMVLMISWGAFFLARMYEHPHRAVFFLLGKIASVCFLLQYLARGNFRRQTKRGLTSMAMLDQLMGAGKDWWAHVARAYLNPVFLVAAFVAAWISPRWKIPLEKKIPAPLILAGCLVLVFGFSFALTIVHALSDVTVGGAGKLPANIVQYSAVIVVFALFACKEYLHLDMVRKLGKPLGLVVVVAVLIVGNSNFFPVLWNGLLGETERYAQAHEKRKATIARHKGQSMAVMPLLYAPTPLFADSLVPGFKSWPNKYAAPFYHLEGLEAKEAAAGDAYMAAERQGPVEWKEAGNGTRTAYVPSLPLPPNETYVFDWLFVAGSGDGEPGVKVVVLEEGSLLLRLPTFLGLERLRAGEWPFRGIFARPRPRPFTHRGGRFYAIPLPQSDSAVTGIGKKTFLSIDGSPFFPAMGNRSVP